MEVVSKQVKNWQLVTGALGRGLVLVMCCVAKAHLTVSLVSLHQEMQPAHLTEESRFLPAPGHTLLPFTASPAPSLSSSAH